MADDIDQYLHQLRSHSATERESAAEVLGDCLEYINLSTSRRSEITRRLIDAACIETNETALESILNALGSATAFGSLCADVPWDRIGELLPNLDSPLLEYGLELLGECGNRQMLTYVVKYLQDSRTTVLEAAEYALSLLASSGQ